MRLVCPKCASQYEVDVSLFPEEGREVQCSSCEEVWVQYPVTDPPAEAPMRLDLAAAPAAAAASSPRPSDRLDEAERSALRDAVAEEIDVHSRGALDRRESFADTQADAEPEDDAAIVKALREQIKAEGGGDFTKSKGKAMSQKRNLKVAAEAVGVDVEKEEDDSDRRKWNLSSHEGKGAQTSSAGGRRDGLAQAIQRYEEEVGPMRPKRRVRRGFMAALVLVVLGAGVFMARDQIIEAYPPAAPYLEQYAAYVQEGRVMAEELYAEYQPIVMGKIAEFTEGGEAE